MKKILQHELEEIEQKYPKAERILVGDFNSRIGEEDICKGEDEEEICWLKRRSKDKMVNREGRHFYCANKRT